MSGDKKTCRSWNCVYRHRRTTDPQAGYCGDCCHVPQYSEAAWDELIKRAARLVKRARKKH